MERLFAGNKMARSLDFVSAWYLKAAQLMQGTAIRVAFVSTNSITQGEQVSPLWGELMGKYGVKIHFAHRTFRWSNEAKGNAAVYCVIIGFGLDTPDSCRLFDYPTPRSAPQEIRAKTINAYLVDGPNVLIANRSRPMAPVPTMARGSMPTDGGHFMLSDEEKAKLLAKEPLAQKFIRRYLGAREFLHNEVRWCLWLKAASPGELKALPLVAARVEAVRQARLASPAPSTRAFAQFPTLFRQDGQPSTDFLALPEVSSENRTYIPIAFLGPDVVPSNKLQLVPEATPFLFGMLTSIMHMTWVKLICGRLKADINYGNSLVYNNFPFPENPAPRQTAAVEAAAQAVLAARAEFAGESLATLYDPLTMPPALVRAHATLDRAVDACYRPAAFATELSRLEFLFGLYRQLQAPLLPAPAPARRKRQ